MPSAGPALPPHSHTGCHLSPEVMALQVLYATSGDGIAIFHRSGDSLSLHGVSPAPSGAFTTSPNRAFMFVANEGHILSFAVDPATGVRLLRLTDCA